MQQAQDKFVAHACFVSTLNYYYRTYEDKHDQRTGTGWKLRAKDIPGLDRQFHNWLIALRNKVIAHHDREEHSEPVVFPSVELRNDEIPDLLVKFYHVPIPMAALTFGIKDEELAKKLVDHVGLVFDHVKRISAETLVALAGEVRNKPPEEVDAILRKGGTKLVNLHEEHGPLPIDAHGVATFVIDPTSVEPEPPKSSSKVAGLSVLRIRIDIKDGSVLFMNKVE